jgi:PD-(D/E)XK nuclease superfamily
MTVKLAHSYTALKQYETCPKRYYHQRITKEVVDQPGPATVHGERVHKQLEDALKDKAELPPETAALQPLCDTLRTYAAAEGATLTIEQEYTLTSDLQQTTWFAPDAWLRFKLDALVLRPNGKAVVVDWKGLALDTRIPTPTGWTTMGALQVGDVVFDANGEQCRVVGKSGIKHIRCFEVTFDDTTKVVCDEEHLWKLTDGAVVGVQDLMGRRGKRQRSRPPRVAVAAPMALPDVALPIDPYVLGLWLADGKHTSGELSKPDAFVWEEVQRRGYQVNMETGGAVAGCPSRTIRGLRSQLRATNLLGNKHIPLEYLRAGYRQRLDLLRGLMDGDGNANPARKQAVFTTTDRGLSDAVCELLCSLGQRPLQSKVRAKGFGVEVDAYPVSFRPLGLNPFLLPRKADRVSADWARPLSATRVAVSVVEVPSVPTQCIAVDSEDHTFLCTDRMIPTHNTGKRRPDFDQLEMFALAVFSFNPEVRKVTSMFVWTKENAIDKETYRAEHKDAMWTRLLSRIHRVEKSLETGNWPAKPSGLCKFCPCKGFCEFAS